MLKLLLKKQIAEIFRSYFYDSKKNCARSKAGIICYIIMFIIVMVGVLGGMFTFLSLLICRSLSAADMDWLYFTLMGLLAVVLGVFGSVFNTYSCLYLSKDNDLLLSMPIPVNVIMTSRLLAVYLMGLMYSLVVIFPAVIVYWVTVKMTAVVAFGGILLMLLISVFVMTLSCVLGWVVAKISLKLKNKSFITVVVSLTFIGLYYFIYFKAQAIIQDLMVNAAVYGESIKGTAYWLYLFGRVAVGDMLAVAVVSGVIFGLFALIWILISRSFLKIATSTGYTAKRAYKERTAKQKSVSAALLTKEFRRFFSSPNYMLNCGLGIIMLPISGVLLIWKGKDLISALNGVFGERLGLIPVLISTVVCLIASMNDMTAPSVSLEGKNLWLMQSLPVTPWQVLRAKLNVQLILTVLPVLFCIGCSMFVYSYSIIELILTVLVTVSYVVLSALFGMFLGLKMPNLIWTSEITPIKQSACVAITLFCGLGYNVLLCAGLILLYRFKLSFAAYMLLFGGCSLALCALLWTWLRNRGCSRFAAL